MTPYITIILVLMNDDNNVFFFILTIIKLSFSSIAKGTVTPPLNGQLSRLLTSDISLETDGVIG